MAVAVLATLLAAALAPALHRIAGRWTGWLLALIPFAWLGWLISRAPRISDGEPVTDTIEWVPALDLNIALYLDGLGLVMAILVAGIGGVVLIYTGAYFKSDDPGLGRFYAFMLGFIGAMLGLVLADNLLSLFIAWELTSVLSFLLIGFKYDSAESRRSAQQALLITGGGGLALLAGLLALGVDAGAWEFSAIRESGYSGAGNLGTWAMVLIIAGAFTKSAQFPFHFWLPNAMVAPTPVSSYLHSAAMVKAGVYLLARVHPTFSDAELWKVLLVSFGAVTMVMAGWFAVRETDLKRILAFTTVSALGTITMLLGLGTSYAVKAAIMFLAGHALYKGALFMAAGAIDHGAHSRDIRVLRGLRREMPFTTVAIVLAAVSMAGIPPAMGFFGKETLLAAGLNDGGNALVVAASVISGILAFGAASLVVVRPLFGARLPDSPHGHEGGVGLWIGPVVLAATGFVAVALGSRTAEYFLAPAANAIYGGPVEVKFELIPADAMLLALSGVTLGAGALLSLLFYRRPKLPLTGGPPAIADSLYDRSVKGAVNGAARFVGVIQCGSLPVYVAIALTTAAAAIAVPMFADDGWRRPDFSGLEFYEAVLGALIVAAAVAAALLHSRMAAVAALGVVGYGVALLYALRGAPDLAMTQVLVETLTVLVFVFVFLHLPALVYTSTTRARVRDAVIAVALAAPLTGLTWAIQQEPANRDVSAFFRDASVPLAYGRNVVNTILVDFRALDTLGEIAVLGIAGIGVIALLRLKAKGGSRT